MTEAERQRKTRRKREREREREEPIRACFATPFPSICSKIPGGDESLLMTSDNTP